MTVPVKIYFYHHKNKPERRIEILPSWISASETSLLRMVVRKMLHDNDIPSQN